MGIREWIRYHNMADYAQTVENPDPDEEEDDESNDPDSEWYIDPWTRQKLHEQARREAAIMKRLHFDDLHRDFGEEPAWYHKPQVAQEELDRFEQEHPRFMAEYRARHGSIAEMNEDEPEESEDEGYQGEEEEHARGSGFWGWLFGR